MKEILLKLRAAYAPERVIHWAEQMHAHAVPYVATRGRVHVWDGVSYYFSTDDDATYKMLQHHKAVRNGKTRHARGGKGRQN